jgi:hypothetical protein
MSQRGVLIVAAALTAFVLVIAGGIFGRLSQPRPATAASPATRTIVATRAADPRPRLTRAEWHDDDERGEHEHHRQPERSHDDDD